MQNIFEVINTINIKNLVTKNPDKIIVLFLVVDEVENGFKIWCKKYLKSCAQNNPSFLFIYCNVMPSDFKILPIIKDNTDLYPLVYYIFGGKCIEIIENADQETIVTSYTELATRFKSSIENNDKQEKKKAEENKIKLAKLESYYEDFNRIFFEEIKLRKNENVKNEFDECEEFDESKSLSNENVEDILSAIAKLDS